MIKNRQSIFSYCLIMVVVFLFMVFFAYNTSPFTEYYGVDSGMYLVMGRAMCQGKILYADLFDHKGPMIFIINMLGQLFINGTLGVWIIECIFHSISAILLWILANRYMDRILSFSIPLIYIWVTVTLFNGGNYTEEYSNFFSVLAIFLYDSWEKNQKKHPFMLWCIGICSGFIFFFRPNNVALVFIIIIFIGIATYKHNKRELKSFFGYGSLGIFTVMLPICIYHLLAGTFYEMLVATVLHNLKYCAVGDESFRLIPNGNIAQLCCFFISIGIIIVAMCSCFSSNEFRRGSFIIAGAVMIAIAILIGKHSFMYYWTLLAPLTSYAAIFVLKDGAKKRKKTVSQMLAIGITFLICLNSFLAVNIIEKKNYINDFKQGAHELYNMVPDDEKDDCFAYNASPIFMYEVNVPVPCKYLAMQSWMAKVNPEIETYCVEYVSTNKPKWIFVGSKYAYEVETAPFKHLIMSGYELKLANDYGSLYQRMDVKQ